jgi:hypothetical protein
MLCGTWSCLSIVPLGDEGRQDIIIFSGIADLGCNCSTRMRLLSIFLGEMYTLVAIYYL